MSPPGVHIELFGGLRICLAEGKSVEVPRQQTGALLAHLALNLNRAHGREELAALIWPEDGPEEERHKLRQSLYALRRLLGQSPSDKNGFLLTTRTTIQLNRDAVTTDTAHAPASA